MLNSRAPYDQLGFTPASNDILNGTPGRDAISGDPVAPDGDGLPGARAFFTFDDVNGNMVEDARGGPSIGLYDQTVLGADAVTAPELRTGPHGGSDNAVVFDGETTFGFLDHHAAFEVSQGTIALWVQPDSLTDDMMILSKDLRNSGDGGHFRLGIEEDGRLFIRFADGDGGRNKAWESVASYFDVGEWTHVAVNFTREGGIEVFVNGSKVPDVAWIRKEGNEDLPSLQSEAYLLNNREPWIIGADTSRTENNDTPDDFAQDAAELRDPFHGAVSGFGFWGGEDADDALTAEQIRQLMEEGPGDALTAPSDPQPILAGNDTITGGDDSDTLSGDGGDDELRGEGGDDSLSGGYGDDALDGGDGNDVLDGGRGSDLLMGGDGDDILISRSDAGEQRIGQLVVGDPTRGDQFDEVNFEAMKLYGWEDQPLVADDILIGGAGRDTFYFNPLLNAKREFILEHANSDGTINWARVAGENDNLHDHWVDSFGIDVIADYRAGEDTIAVVGHTANVRVRYEMVDTDGDGEDDQRVSVIDVYSQQGANGGAHTLDLIGQIVVFGDRVNEDDILVNAKVTHGIVETIDELQEALAPTGDTKVSLIDGEEFLGYDSRDDQGNLGAVVESPFDFITSPFLDDDRVSFATDVPEGTPEAAILLDETVMPDLNAMTFNGGNEDAAGVGYVNIPHFDALAREEGTYAFTFTANSPGEGYQALLSKDARTFVDGGHLTIWVDDERQVKVRYQSTDENKYLRAEDLTIEPGETYHVTFTFSSDQAVLYVNGEQYDIVALDDEDSYADGMSGNMESLIFGAAATSRTSGEVDRLKDFFDGTIDDVVVLDRALFPSEVAELATGVLPLAAAEAPVMPAPSDDSEGASGEASDEAVAESDDSPESQAAGAELVGDRRSNEIEGTGGDDSIRAGAGHDTVFGGDGEDLINAGGGADRVFAGDGDDTVDGANGQDRIFGDDGDDLIDGQNGHDLLIGGEGSDTLVGGTARDTLIGGDGDDLIEGGRGNDLIEGGAGDDELVSGGGRDLFRYHLSEDTDDFGLDVITDFNVRLDRIQVDDDLQVEIELLSGYSQVTLRDTDGTVVGQIDVVGVELTDRHIETIPEDAELYFMI